MSKFTTFIHILGNLVLIRKKIWSIFILMALYVICLASSPYFFKFLMDGLERDMLQKHISFELYGIIILWMICILATIIVRYFYGMYLLETVQKDWFGFLNRSMKMMLRLPIDYHISTQHGEKQKIIDRASESVWDMGDSGLLHIVPQFFVMIILIVSGFFIDTRMTLISLILLPFSIYGIHKLGNTAYLNQKKANTLWDTFFSRITDAFTNLRIIRIFSREQQELDILTQKFSHARDAQYHIRKFWVVYNGLGNLITSLSQAITLSVGIFFVLHDALSLGGLFFFIGFTDRIYGPIVFLFQKFQETLVNIASYEKIQELYQMPKEENHGTLPFNGIQKELSFEAVGFVYPGSVERQVLSNISLQVRKGQKVALIGHTGSGKSTMTQLLMRFYTPQFGSICIDGEDIRNFELASYRSRLACVFQDTTLFNDTIRHNLEYVRDGITQEDLETAARQANILEFIESLPLGWETEVGERGLKLSGGEKQRISIARAFLAQPDILILDEATSALDTMTEKLIQSALEKLMEDRTSIIIAHRLSTIQHVDTIFLMEQGRVVASGNHKELYEISAVYREMVGHQHDGFMGD